jgi:hypothetical protein
VINVLNKDDPDWWEGEVDGIVGLFPSNYVAALNEPAEEPYGTVVQPSMAIRMYIGVIPVYQTEIANIKIVSISSISVTRTLCFGGTCRVSDLTCG